jgi:hypothetical protein
VIARSSPSRRESLSRQSRTCRLIDCTLRSRPNIRIRSPTFTVVRRPRRLRFERDRLHRELVKAWSTAPPRPSQRSVRTASHHPSSKSGHGPSRGGEREAPKSARTVSLGRGPLRSVMRQIRARGFVRRGNPSCRVQYRSVMTALDATWRSTISVGNCVPLCHTRLFTRAV